MPRLIRPTDAPELVRTAVDVLGNGARAVIMHWLASHGPTSTAQVAAGTGLPTPTVIGHLAALERAGLIAADLPPGHRRGRAVHWATDPGRVRALMAAYRRYLLGATR